MSQILKFSTAGCIKFHKIKPVIVFVMNCTHLLNYTYYLGFILISEVPILKVSQDYLLHFFLSHYPISICIELKECYFHLCFERMVACSDSE